MKLILFFLCLISVNIYAEQALTLADAFSQGNLKGLIRYSAQHRDSNLHLLQDSDANTPSTKIQQYSALGGYLAYETAAWYHSTLGFTFYTSNPVGNNPDDRSGLGGLDESNGSQEAYSVLGESFLSYQYQQHAIKLGRQEVRGYRFISMSNIRMTPVTHEGITYKIKSENSPFQANFAYISQQKDRNATSFEGMARAARIQTGCGEVDNNGDCLVDGSKKLIRGSFNNNDYDTQGSYQGASKGMLALGGQYSNQNNHLELWGYSVEDFVNTFYTYAHHQFQLPANDQNIILALQYSHQKDTGAHIAGNIDTGFYGIKAQYNAPGFILFTAFNEVTYNEDSYDGGSIFVRWGTPQMFNSFQVQDSELAGTQSVGAGMQYDFGDKNIIPGVVMRIRFAQYDMPDALNQQDARQDRSETTFDLRYSFSQKSGFGIFTQLEGLSLQFRIAYNDYETDYDFAAYQSLHGYTFNSVTDDFIDTRLYLDYHF